MGFGFIIKDKVIFFEFHFVSRFSMFFEFDVCFKKVLGLKEL